MCVDVCWCVWCVWCIYICTLGGGCPCKCALIQEKLSFSIPKAPNTIPYGINMHSCITATQSLASMFGCESFTRVFYPKQGSFVYIKHFGSCDAMKETGRIDSKMTFTSSSMSILRGSRVALVKIRVPGSLFSRNVTPLTGANRSHVKRLDSRMSLTNQEIFVYHGGSNTTV